MSVLTRAYLLTRQEEYLSAASRALSLFHFPTYRSKVEIGVEGGSLGVTSKFMGQQVWYEEYPTEPSTFILNGFMYSLFGLYDLWQTAEAAGKPEPAKEAKTLFQEGEIC